MKIRQQATEQPVGQRRNQKKKKYCETNENTTYQSLCNKNSFKKEIHSNKCLCQKQEVPINNLTLFLKEVR